MRWLPILFVALVGSCTLLDGIGKNLNHVSRWINFISSFPGAPAPEVSAEFDDAELYTEDGKNVVTCTLCATVVEDVIILLENGTVTDEQIVNYIINTCAALNIFTNPDLVCGGVASTALVRG